MHDDFIQRLRSAENDFLVALGCGTQMLTSYSQIWSALLADLSKASLTGSVCNETLSLAHLVASRISNIASCYLDVRREEESFSAQFLSDCDAMIHQMGALDLNATVELKSLPQDGCAGSSSTLAPAYKWLMENLHNPYPSAEAKAQIATACSCGVSSVNSWFINARRRIGWTTLCREHFSNRRADMVDAAYRALIKEDPQRILSPELRHSFVAMKVAAEGLCLSAFTRSAFTVDLDTIVTEKDMQSVGVGKCNQAVNANFWMAAQNSYPSPDSSNTASPVLPLDLRLTGESEKEVDVPPSIIAGSKRRRLSVEPVDQLTSTVSRPVKRLRASMTSQACLPSPPSSTDGVNESPVHRSTEFSLVHSHTTGTDRASPSHKQCFTCADVTGTPSRPSNPVTDPRLHTAADLPTRSSTENEYSVDDWFKTNFDDLFVIPPPVNAIEPDFSASWEVELFKDYSIPGHAKDTPKCAPAPTADIHMSVPPNSSEPDSLLQSIVGDAPIILSDSVLPPRLSGVSDPASLQSSIPVVLQTDIDWISLFNSPGDYHPAVYSSFPQYPIDPQPLPEIDISMLQLPQVIPTVYSQGDMALKRTRLHRLYSMQEAVWRMEQELRSEGVVMCRALCPVATKSS